MKKIKYILITLFLLSALCVFSLVIEAKAQSQNKIQNQIQNQTQNQTQNQGMSEQLRIEERNQEQTQTQTGPSLTMPSKNCENKCGDKICQKVVCMAIGCPCAETEENCPQDCVFDNRNQKGQVNAQQHRSTVANFVQTLLNAADKEVGGIGEQVRNIAREQNQSATKTLQAMEKVQNRSKIRTFLLGPDYKNLGALRSEVVQTRNRLRQLNQLMQYVENEGDRLQLQNQIQEMEQEQARIENFIKEQEGKFSLFGWLMKLIQGYKNSKD